MRTLAKALSGASVLMVFASCTFGGGAGRQVPLRPQAEPVRPATPAPQATPAATPHPGVPVVTVLGAEAQPPEPKVGERVKLVVQFDVSGLGTGETVTVAEERQILFEDKPLFSSPRSASQAWGNGSHASVWDFDVPAQMKPGIYTFVVTVRAPGTEARKEALFVVKP